MFLPRAFMFPALLLSALAIGAAPPEPSFDQYVVEAMRAWKVAGLAVAIVKDDRIVFVKGYGVRRAGTQTAVDERTLFAIGSTTKAFTATAAAVLAGDGKLKFDDPVIKYLPTFRLYDPYVTREITIRDLLAHKSGLPSADVLRLAGLRPGKRFSAASSS